ncbi:MULTISPECIES: hypothetical protein [unclassified Pseudomonas]|uniref:hypothetical protein n=1 Tax=unclassified Pseudomonas TaxID=196821 RepID=UPI002447F472|nr:MULTISPECIES: hypothetical protein [unclassified Pseudomonas]MDH0894044.1 hypothetical protein [Pseudomonas sp. GD03875]MDH1062799.1 hypothetical protein [Pseudomonas sp. GD03985]
MQVVMGLILIILGVPFVVFNCYAFYGIFVRKENISWIPIVGGGTSALGLYLLQNPFWWLFLFFDFGCVLGFSHSFLFYRWVNPWVKRMHDRNDL